MIADFVIICKKNLILSGGFYKKCKEGLGLFMRKRQTKVICSRNAQKKLRVK